MFQFFWLFFGLIFIVPSFYLSYQHFHSHLRVKNPLNFSYFVSFCNRFHNQIQLLTRIDYSYLNHLYTTAIKNEANNYDLPIKITFSSIQTTSQNIPNLLLQQIDQANHLCYRLNYWHCRSFVYFYFFDIFSLFIFWKEI